MRAWSVVSVLHFGAIPKASSTVYTAPAALSTSSGASNYPVRVEWCQMALLAVAGLNGRALIEIPPLARR